MAEQTAIQWCDSTFNPWIGCTKVSTAASGGGGCDGCYAEVSTPVRVLRSKGIETWGPHAERHRTSAGNWALPRRWDRQHGEFYAEHGRRRRVFCASLADVFDNAAAAEWRGDLWALIEVTRNLDWLLTTKRIGNVRGMVPAAWLEPGGWPAHVRILITVVTQDEADRDIPKLLALGCPNGLSMEPLLGPVDLTRVGGDAFQHGAIDALTGRPWVYLGPDQDGRAMWDMGEPGKLIDWVIVGGESGPDARPMHPDWVRSLRDQCAAAGVPFLFKQWGEWTPGENVERQRGTVDTAFWWDGRWGIYPLNLATDSGHIDDQPDLYRIGKKAAGRLLDGVEHNGFPRVDPRKEQA